MRKYKLPLALSLQEGDSFRAVIDKYDLTSWDYSSNNDLYCTWQDRSSLNIGGKVISTHVQDGYYLINFESCRKDIVGDCQVKLAPDHSITWIHETVPLEIEGIICDIDENIAPLISVLNQIGYETEHCCEGQEETYLSDSIDGYITFRQYHDASSFVMETYKRVGLQGFLRSMHLEPSYDPRFNILRGCLRMPPWTIQKVQEIWTQSS